MDRIDWCIFVIALLAIPVSVWFNIRWWIKSRSSGLPRDWQSLAMIVVGLVCMVAIAAYYLFKFILPGAG